MSNSEALPFPEDALEERFLAASGPGGQNVNKVATAVQLRVNLFRLGLAPPVFARLKQLADTRVSGAGELIITARRFRTQEANRQDARARLAALIAQAHVAPVKRIRTKASRAAKARRMEEKTRRGAIKQARTRPRHD